MKNALIFTGRMMEAALAFQGLIFVSKKPEEDLPEKELNIPRPHEVRPPIMTAVTALPESSSPVLWSIHGRTE